MKIPTLPFSPNDFRWYPKHGVLVRHVKAPAPGLVEELYAFLKVATYEEAKSAIRIAGIRCGTFTIGVLYMAVEPAPGNTLLHIAILAQRTCQDLGW